MKFNYFIKCILYAVGSVLLLMSFNSCSENLKLDEQGDDVEINFQVGTKSLLGNYSDGVDVATMRIVAIHSSGRDVRFNRSTHDGQLVKDETPGLDGHFVTKLRTGDYRLYAIGNETSTMTTAFSSVKTKDALEDIIVAGTFTEADLVLFGAVDIKVRPVSEGSLIGEVSTDGGLTWVNILTVEAERVASKISLSIRKNTTDPSDTFVVKKAEVINLPKFSYMQAKQYVGDRTASATIYNDATGVSFLTNMPAEQFTSIGNPVIIPEFLPSPNNAANAAVLVIHANYKGLDVIYNVPLRGKLAVEDYDLLRNRHYHMRVTITKRGEFDYRPYVEYEVLPWTDAGNNNFNIDDNITFTGNWAPGTVTDGTNKVLVYNNNYVEYRFILNYAVGSTWTATLSNAVNFEFDYSGTAVSSGSTQAGIEYIIRVKPKAPVATSVTTEFFISVNNGVRNIELDLKGSSSTGPGNRYLISQIPQ